MSALDQSTITTLVRELIHRFFSRGAPYQVALKDLVSFQAAANPGQTK